MQRIAVDERHCGRAQHHDEHEPKRGFRMAARSEPVWAFFDFDPAGLGMASSVPRLARLDGDRQRELYARSAPQWSGVLDAAAAPQIQAAWSLMRYRRAGLAQEAMREVLAPADET